MECVVKVKVKVDDIWYSAFYGPTPPQKRSSVARVFQGSNSFICQQRVYPRMEWTIPVFAFSAAGLH